MVVAIIAWSGTLRTIFLDRDGVLNEKMPEGRYVTDWTEFQLLAGVPEAVARMNRAGLRVIVVSNQRGVSLGLYSAAQVDGIHARFQHQLAEHGAHIDAFYFCPHDKNQCDCRKPLPGMFDQARRDFPDITPQTSVMIGDSLSDIEFGRGIGMRTIFINGNPDRRKEGAEKAAHLADLQFASLSEAVAALLPVHQDLA
jgi:D-glycero-D-manno-heptose 1,7-bisphosphate phosphatase